MKDTCSCSTSINGEHFRSFVVLKSGLSSFRIGGPRPIDEKKLDFQAAFFEVGSSEGSNWINRRLKLDQLSSRPAGDALRVRAFD
jgi:hypothetical protein